MVIVPVVPVLAGLEQDAELDGLVGLVMVHRPQAKPCQAKRQRERQRRQHQAAEDAPAHVSGVP